MQWECVCLSSVALNVSVPVSGSLCLMLPEFLQEQFMWGSDSTLKQEELEDAGVCVVQSL